MNQCIIFCLSDDVDLMALDLRLNAGGHDISPLRRDGDSLPNGDSPFWTSP